MREVVAVAGSAADEEAIEDVLDAAGIEYEIGLEAAEGGEHRVCYLGRSYAVAPEVTERVRSLLLSHGLERALSSQ